MNAQLSGPDLSEPQPNVEQRKPGRASSKKLVAIVFKTHLDIGFTDLATNVIRRYMDFYIPQALELAAKTRHEPRRFV